MKMNYVRKMETKNFEDNVNDARKGGRGFNMSNTATRGTTEKSYPFQQRLLPLCYIAMEGKP